MNVTSRVFSRLGLAVAFMSMIGAHSTAPAATIDWVTVGDLENVADTTGYGAVDYEYKIMQYEFTNLQYAAFLNAVDPEGLNPSGIYNSLMGSEARGGITNTGETNGSRYAVKVNMGAKPVIYVDCFSVARVANWLQAGGQTYASTASGSTAIDGGAYTLNGATSGDFPARNSGALYALPTENEWYKAAFYTGTGSTYTLYGNGFGTAPTAVTADETGDGSAGSTGNFANFNFGADWNEQNGNVTTVGTNGAASAYGAYDMSGNVNEWIDAGGFASFRMVRGGGYLDGEVALRNTYRNGFSASQDLGTVGFRLVSPVPEPSTYAMALAGLACGGYTMFRRRKRA